MKLIYLTAITTAPTEEAEKKIEEAGKKQKIRDDETLSKEWYRQQGLKPPPDAPDEDEFGNVILEDEDLEEVLIPVSIPLDNLDSWAATIDGDTIVYTKGGIFYHVEESVWEIDAYIELNTMSWFRRNYLFFKSFLANLFNKKDINY